VESDLDFCEENGSMPGADPSQVGVKASGTWYNRMVSFQLDPLEEYSCPGNGALIGGWRFS